MSGSEKLIAGAVVVALGVLLLRKFGSKVNPTSRDNIVYSGVNAVGDVLSDGQADNDFSLGAWIYDVTHPQPILLNYPAPPTVPYRN